MVSSPLFLCFCLFVFSNQSLTSEYVEIGLLLLNSAAEDMQIVRLRIVLKLNWTILLAVCPKNPEPHSLWPGSCFVFQMISFSLSSMECDRPCERSPWKGSFVVTDVSTSWVEVTTNNPSQKSFDLDDQIPWLYVFPEFKPFSSYDFSYFDNEKH